MAYFAPTLFRTWRVLGNATISLAKMLAFYLLLVVCLLLGKTASLKYLKDEDVRLKVFSPVSEVDQRAVDLELKNNNQDEEFLVSIVSENGAKIYEGQFINKVKCTYNTRNLKDGDNTFHITIRSVETNEIVFHAIHHFVYESKSAVKGGGVDFKCGNRVAIIAGAGLLLLSRYTLPAYQSLQGALFGSNTDNNHGHYPGHPPAPPSSPPPSFGVKDVASHYLGGAKYISMKNAVRGGNSSTIATVRRAYRDLPPNVKKLLKAVVVGAAVFLSGRISVGWPRRRTSVAVEQKLPSLLRTVLIRFSAVSAYALNKVGISRTPTTAKKK